VPTQRRPLKNFKIPKKIRGKSWTPAELEIFKKHWPHLKNLPDSVLKHSSLGELSALGKNRASGQKLLSQKMTANYEQLANFPEKVEGGSDNCLGKVHSARFLRGFVGDAQELWLQARENWGIEGIEPIANYEVVSMGLGDLLTPATWAEIHKPNSRNLSIKMLAPKSVEEGWKATEKNETPKEFETMQDFRVAMATLEGGIHKVMPWNMAFKTLYFFMVSNNFGELELSSKPNRLTLLANFVDEILRANARNWEEKKKFLSFQDLAVRWSALFLRRFGSGFGFPDGGEKKKEKSRQGVNEKKSRKIPGWVCRKFNDGRCDSKDDRHPSHWDPNYLLKHSCSKWLNDKNRFCLDNHAERDHK
jgi:hypothetical protein